MKIKIVKNVLKIKHIIKMAVLGAALIFSIRTTIAAFNAEVIVND